MEQQFNISLNTDPEVLYNGVASGEYDNVDEWGVLECISEEDGIGVEYNFCIDNTTGELLDESAFYLMSYNPVGDYWETDYSTSLSYQIMFDDPNWQMDLETQAQVYLEQLLGEINAYT